MKRALVFSGGGSRGAYEIGVWQAMRELGVSFHAVYGASIGAINAALFAQGDFDLAQRLWDQIDLKQVLATDDEDFAIDSMISRKRDVLPFLLENARHLRMDITPLETLLRAHLDERAVRASGMDLGLMTVRVPQMQPQPMHLCEIPEGELIDWILASASCFPVFPTRRIGGERYVDGGYFDNLPIDMAIADGADEIVAVDVHPQPAHPEYARMPFLKMICPLHNLGGFLDFNPVLLRRMRRIGYYDAMKRYGALDGVRYAFVRRSSMHVERQYMRAIARFDAEAIHRAAFRSSQLMDAPLISAIESETPDRALSWHEVWLRGLELAAQAMGFREDAIYDPGDLLCRIQTYLDAGDVPDVLDERALIDAARLGDRELLRAIYRALRRGAPSVDLLAAYPRHTAAALIFCPSLPTN